MNKKLLAALSYLNAALYGNSVGVKDWPFAIDTWSPGDILHNLRSCKELIETEINRLTKS